MLKIMMSVNTIARNYNKFFNPI